MSNKTEVKVCPESQINGNSRTNPLRNIHQKELKLCLEKSESLFIQD
jgi:hypothetical protein